jgi:hypothetical protein
MNTFKAGDIVEVLSFDEIKMTLDERGCYDNLPFMPEMIKYCGQRFRVSAQINLICVNEIGVRGFNNSALLVNVYCDGSYHDGCQKSCTIIWKNAWLKKCSNDFLHSDTIETHYHSENDDLKVVRNNGRDYFCQSSQLAQASEDIKVTSYLRYLMKEFFSGNRKILLFVKDFYHFFYFRLLKLPSDSKCKYLTGEQNETPQESLNLQPGDWVEVKSEEEIKNTLDKKGQNRGLVFSPEMIGYCGKRFKVRQRIEKMISEQTGHMFNIKNTVILEDVMCTGTCKFGCSRYLHHWWREIWLNKI